MSNLIMVSCNVYELFDVLRSSVAQSLLSIPNNIYNEVSEALKKGLATEVIKRYMLALNIDTALKELQNFIDVNRFAEFLTWLEQNYGIYGLRGFSIIKEAETDDILTIGVFLENCNKDEWSEIAQKIKNYLNSNGLVDVAEKVSIICLKGLKELGVEIIID
jgi:hypothetical protein